MPAHTHRPPNISKDPQGYNTKLFPNSRAVRKALRHLGYKVSLTNTPPPKVIVRQFQKHYNHCAIKRFHKWGSLKVDGIAGRNTLNAIEIAMTFARKRGRAHGGEAAHHWQKLCARHRPGRHKRHHGTKPRPHRPEFVEVMGKGVGKLRRPGLDYRVYIHKLAKKGDLLFAQVRIPPQVGLPKGRPGMRWYPALVKPSMPKPHAPHRPGPGLPGSRPKPAPGYPTPGGRPRPPRP